MLSALCRLMALMVVALALALPARCRSVVHPRFTPGSFDADIAALVLDAPSAYTPITLVGRGMRLGAAPALGGMAAMAQQAGGSTAQAGMMPDDEQLGGGALLLAAGWGATEAGALSDVLLEARVTPVSAAACQAAFNPFGSRITRRMLCVTGEQAAGACDV
jgi:hypothetical protein